MPANVHKLILNETKCQCVIYTDIILTAVSVLCVTNLVIMLIANA